MCNSKNKPPAIEAAVIIPIVLMVFVIILTILFYYHDKNIIASVAYETALCGSSNDEQTKELLEQYCQKKLQGRLLIFSNVLCRIDFTDEYVSVECSTYRKGMSIHLKRTMSCSNPEHYIRTMRKIEKIGEYVGAGE